MANFEYRHEITEDGSPTLRLAPTWEPMHALDGAFTETLYIYRPTISDAIKSSSNPRILSVGLGLGYNEMMVACESLKSGAGVHIDSYESVQELRDLFRLWVENHHSDLSHVYDAVAVLFGKAYELSSEDIKTTLARMLASGRLQLHGAITPTTVFTKSHGILFDAFSSKSSPELWTEEFLDYFIKTATAPTCYLSTYASKGALHRTLRSHNFISEKRAGFGKKRESTFAHRLTS